MSDSTIVHPDYIRLIERVPQGWLFKRGRLFYKRVVIASTNFDDFELMYGISKEKVVIELFRVNGGALGYYVADLRHKKYYYCGLDAEEVKTKLQTLGVGRPDPVQ